MDIRILTSPDDLATYDVWVKNQAGGTLWQSLAWKHYQDALGCTTRVYAAFEGITIVAGALVVIDRTTCGFSTWEVPRGPVAGSGLLGARSVMDRIIEDARKERCLALFASPLSPLPSSNEQLVTSNRHIYPEATRIVSLALSDQELLGQMKPKGRYNIRLAERHVIEVRESTDVGAFHALLKRTGDRDRFGIHPLSHYKAFLERLPGTFLLLAYHPRTSDVEPIAGFLGVTWQTTGIYYYGASDERFRALMAPYLLQWEAMHWCKKLGCSHYDLLGVAPPDADDAHPWAGITNFKEKFGGALVMYPPEQQIVLRPFVWRVLQMKRKLVG